MFDSIKEYLNQLSFKEKRELIENLKEFSRLKSLLEAKKIIERDPESQDIWIVKDDVEIPAFLKVYKKMTLQNVKVIDKRK